MANANGNKKPVLDDTLVSFKSTVLDHFCFPVKYEKGRKTSGQDKSSVPALFGRNFLCIWQHHKLAHSFGKVPSKCDYHCCNEKTISFANAAPTIF